jgi:hypothetical protein
MFGGCSALRGGGGAAVAGAVDNDGTADAGRVSLFRLRRAISGAGRFAWLIKTCLAKTECWLVRRGEEAEEDKEGEEEAC